MSGSAIGFILYHCAIGAVLAAASYNERNDRVACTLWGFGAACGLVAATLVAAFGDAALIAAFGA